MGNREPLLRARVAGSWWLVAGGPASHRHPERKRRISVKIASDSNASKYQSAGRLYPRRGLRLRRRGAYGPVLTHGPKVVFAVAQGAKAVVGAFKNNWAPVCIKPYNRPCGRWKSGPPLVAGATTFLPAEPGALWVLSSVLHDTTGKRREVYSSP